MRAIHCFGIVMTLAGAIGSIGLLAAQPPGMVPTSVAHAQADESGCVSAITSTLSASTTRVCDTVTVTVRTESECPACSGGLNVVYVMGGGYVSSSRWMTPVALASLRELERLEEEAGNAIHVAVVQYSATDARTIQPLTDDLGRARTALGRPVPTGPYGGYEAAAREAARILRTARSTAGDLCEIVVFFVVLKEIPGTEPLQEEMLRAAGTIHSARIPLMVGCLSNTDLWCGTAKRMPTSPRFYTEYPAMTKLAGMVKTQALDYLDGGGVSGLVLTQALPAGLEFVDGSARPAPAPPERVGGETLLSWAWEPPETAIPQTVTYQVRPLREGSWPITGGLAVKPAVGALQELSTTPITLTVAGLCITDTPTPSPTSTPTPLPTVTVMPTDTAIPPPTATNVPQPVYLPVSLREYRALGRSRPTWCS